MTYNFYHAGDYVGRLIGPANFNIERVAKAFLANRYGCISDANDFIQHLKDKYDFIEVTYKVFDIAPFCGEK
jgi:hypothetical protein